MDQILIQAQQLPYTQQKKVSHGAYLDSDKLVLDY